MRFSYHTHTVWSDGKSDISEMIRVGGEVGLDEIGISDHYVLTPDGRELDWSMPVDKLSDYVAAVQLASGEAREGLVVRLGLEADFLPETSGDLRGILASEPFDYIIGSVHIVDGFCIDECPENWMPLSEVKRNSIIRNYWSRVREMADTGMFDIVGHLDLYKKFGILSTEDLTREISATLDVIAKVGMSVEVNTAGWYWPCTEAYPDSVILKGCFERGIPVLVSADAHAVENIVRGYERAYALLSDMGYHELASYAGRQRLMQPLS
jgi:histidinol-phosphatase (PHP family)